MVDQNPQLYRAQELLFHAYRRFTEQADALLAEHGWGRVHHRILYFVARQPGVSQQQLLQVLGVSKQALHLPLRQLQHAELLLSSPDENDRRMRRLALTPAGLDLEQQLSKPQHQMLAQVFQKVGDSATLAWMQTLEELAQATAPKPQQGE